MPDTEIEFKSSSIKSFEVNHDEKVAGWRSIWHRNYIELSKIYKFWFACSKGRKKMKTLSTIIYTVFIGGDDKKWYEMLILGVIWWNIRKVAIY